MATQDKRPSLEKRSLEDIAAMQADHAKMLAELRRVMNERFDIVDVSLAQLNSTLAEVLARLQAKE
jgi:hypothetical protein